MWSKNGKCCLPASRVSLRGSRPEMFGCLGKRWMTAAQRKWFCSLFQILNQPLLQATTADINCDTCDFLLPAQIMIVWTTGALAPSSQRHRKRNWLWAPKNQWMVTGINVFINSEFSQAKQNIFNPSTWFRIDLKLHLPLCVYKQWAKYLMSMSNLKVTICCLQNYHLTLQFPPALASFTLLF